jgi:uncharacterized membrane protein YhiD involved in acid resistance
MFELFTSREYYEFPSFETAIFSFLLSFVLSLVVAFTYQITERGEGFSRNFFQALILSSIVTAMILMAIGDSIARGLGIIGAIAIIRFRARITSPRNIIFIFAALSIGIATGVYGYRIAIAGTISFCLVALLVKFSGYGASLRYENRVNLSADLNVNETAIDAIFNQTCARHFQTRLERTKKELRMRYRITMKKETTKQDLINKLLAVEGINSINISVGENADEI